MSLQNNFVRRVGLFLFLFAGLFCSYSCSKNNACAELKLMQLAAINIPPEGRKLPSPRSVTIGKNGEIVILDDCGGVSVADASGAMLRSWKMPDWKLGKPEGVCVLQDGRIAISDTHYNRVVIFNADGSLSLIFGDKGAAPGKFGNPVGITQDEKGDLYISEYGEMNRVQKFTQEGKFLMAFGENGNGPGQFERASGISWHEGKIFAADAVNNRIQVFADNGKFLYSIGGKDTDFSFYLPYDLYFHGKDFYVVEYGAGRISKLGEDGKLLGRFGSPGRGAGNFTTPWGICVDPEGRVYVADTGNRRVVILK